MFHPTFRPGRVVLACLIGVVLASLAKRALGPDPAVATLGVAPAGVPWADAARPGPRLPADPAAVTATAPLPPAAVLPAGRLSLLRQAGELPAWAVKYGHEFWRAPESGSPGAVKGFAAKKTVHVQDAVERVNHAFAAQPDSTGAVLESSTYRARVEADGLRLTPGRPAGVEQTGGSVEARLATVRVAGEGQVYFDASLNEARSWVVLGNTAQALLDAPHGIVEHYEARTRGVELTWVIPQALGETGPLAIETTVEGMAEARLDHGAVHFSDADGVARLRVGPAQAVDAGGRRWELAMSLNQDRLRVEVPAEVLDGAIYPLAIDPWISPEFGIDQPVASPQTPSTQAMPSVAASGQATLVVWTHGKGDLTPINILAARLSPEGALLDPYGLVIAPAANEQVPTAVAANGDEFLVVWSAPKLVVTTDWDILAARVDPLGAVRVLPPVCSAAGVQASPVAAGNGTDFYVAWRDSRNTGIYGALLKKDDTLSATNGTSLTAAINDQYFPAVASLGAEFLVVWQDYRKASATLYNADIYGTRISATGEVVDPAGIPIATRTNTQWFPALAANGTNYLVVWEEYDAGGNNICGARVSPAGVVLDTNALAVSVATNLQGSPAVASYQGEFLVVWQDFRRCNRNVFESDIYAARVDGAGQVLDPEGLAMATAVDNQCHPGVAAVATGYQIVWQDSRNNPANTLAEIYGLRLDALGHPLNPGETLVSRAANYQTAPAVAGNGSNYLVVWSENRNAATTGLDIYGARLDATGQVLDAAGIALCRAPGDQTAPAVAANGKDYLVVWADARNGSVALPNLDIYGARINAEGQVQDLDGLAIGAAPYEQNYPAVAAKGGRYLVVWQDARASATNAVRWDIFGARVGTDGLLPDPAGLRITGATNDQTLPAVTANSTHWLVVWEDRRTSTNADIYGARVDDAGQVVETDGIPICTALLKQASPVAAVNGEDFLVVWTDARNTSTGLDIYGARVNRDGTVPDTNNLAIRRVANQQSSPTLVANGNDYFMAWQEAVTGATNSYNIAGVSLAGDGAAIPNSLMLVDTNANDQLAPALAGLGNGFLVVNQGFLYGGARSVASRVILGPRFAGAQTLAGGRFQGSLAGVKGQRYTLEVSSDLNRWIALATLTNADGVAGFVDPNAPAAGARFYRAILLP